MKTKYTVLEELITNSVDNMPDEFDTHQLILDVAKLNQRAYIDALNECVSDRPFQTVHSLIGKSLKKQTNINEMPDKHKSVNIFGEKSECSKWIKV